MADPRSAREEFVKHRADAPPGFFAVEAAGLAWLGGALPAGGVPTVQVLEVATDRIRLRRLTQVPATAAAAERFGRALSATHRAGAAWFGAPPDGWHADGWIGPLPLPATLGPDPVAAGWGPFFAPSRLRP